MPATTPRKVQTWALRVTYAAAPCAVFVNGLWLVRPPWLHLPARDPDLLFGLGLVLTMTALAAGMVAALSGGQLAIAKAFMAGYNTGLAIGSQHPDGDNGDGGARPLRLVE